MTNCSEKIVIGWSLNKDMLISLTSICKTNEVIKFIRFKDKDGKKRKFLEVEVRFEWWLGTLPPGLDVEQSLNQA